MILRIKNISVTQSYKPEIVQVPSLFNRPPRVEQYAIIADTLWGELVIKIYNDGYGTVYIPDRTIADSLKHLWNVFKTMKGE